MDKMDNLDRMLVRLPSTPGEEDLANRVLRYVRARRRRALQIHLGLSLALAAGGVWFVLPLTYSLPSSSAMSSSGMAILVDWLQAGLAGIGSLVGYLWDGVIGMQSSLATPVTVSVWIGLAALTLSALLALGPLLPRSIDSGYVNQGVNV